MINDPLKPEQYEKALSETPRTVSCIFKSPESLVHPENAYESIETTESGMIRSPANCKQC